MAQLAGLQWTASALIVAGVLFYLTSVTGAFWGTKTPPTDIGLYAVTIVLLGFGLGCLFLRHAKLHAGVHE